jgi:hypothetical protein
MNLRCLVFATLVGLGLGMIAALPTPAADKADAGRVAELVKQLGSAKFEERERATQTLDEIGLPALEALRQAAKSDDAETRRRAQDLVSRIEKRGESAKILTATRVRLVYNDTPVAEAVADLAKKTGYPVTLYDPQNKLADRKVTLDTGDTTFWQALDQLCYKAGLVTADARTLTPGTGGTRPSTGTRPSVPLQPALPAQPVPPAKQPRPGTLPVPPEKDVKKDFFQAQAGAQAEAKPAQAPAPNVPRIQAAPAGAAPAQLQPARPVPAVIDRPTPGVGGQLILTDGKPQQVPTCYADAVRIRALPFQAGAGAAPRPDEYAFTLEVLPEPKLQWLNLVSLRVDKALDDKGQQLAQAAAVGEAPANPNDPVVANLAVAARIAAPLRAAAPQVPVRLKKGEKASASLKEFTGSIAAQVRTEPEPLLTVENVMQAAGQEAKGKEGGFIKVLEVSKDAKNGVKLRVQLETPPGVQPGNLRGGGVIGGGGAGGGVQILPALPPQAVPPQPPNPPQAQAAPAPVQVQAVQIQGAPAQVQIQVAPANPGGFVAAPAGVGGLNLFDDKGQRLPLALTASSVRAANNVVTYEYTFQCRPQNGQGDPAKLVFAGSKTVTVEVPFTLKDVPLP